MAFGTVRFGSRFGPLSGLTCRSELGWAAGEITPKADSPVLHPRPSEAAASYPHDDARKGDGPARSVGTGGAPARFRRSGGIARAPDGTFALTLRAR